MEREGQMMWPGQAAGYDNMRLAAQEPTILLAPRQRSSSIGADRIPLGLQGLLACVWQAVAAHRSWGVECGLRLSSWVMSVASDEKCLRP